MPKYRVPCWLDLTHDFEVVVEASSPTNALLELHRLVTSHDPDDQDYVEACIVRAGNPSTAGVPVDWTDDPSLAEEVHD